MSDLQELASTAPDRIAHRIRLDIVNGRFRPGERLKIADLTSMYGLSQMPVREALRELEGEGLFDISPHRGATVRGVDERFIRNIYDVREALECMLTRRCVERITQVQLAIVQNQIVAHENASAKDTAALLHTNLAIHRTINVVADNPEALRLLGIGRALVEAMRMSYGFRPGRVKEIVREHRELYEAIAAKDVEHAVRIAQKHVIGARDDLLDGYLAAKSRNQSIAG